MAATDDSKFLSKAQYEVTLQRLAMTTGRTLGANSDNSFKVDLSSSDRVLGSWTHPTNGTTGAKTLNTSNQVIKTLVFDKYGHVTGATQGALTADDIPSLNTSKLTAGTLGVARGGTGKGSWTQYGIVYASATDTLAQIAVPTWAASTTYWLKCVTNSSKVPTYSLSTIGKSDVGLGNVENTALSTWAGTNKITTVGTISTGTWHGSVIGTIYGGTGLNSYAKGDILYASDTNVLAKLAANTTTTRKYLLMTSSTPSWVQLFVGRTEVATSAANVTLLGINGFTNTASASTSNDKSLVVWDSANNAWHFKGNLYADGWVSALGAGSGSGGGGVDGIDILRAWADYSADDETQVLGSNLAYNMNQRITALENSATSVTFAQTLTSGKEIGTLTIDGASVKLYAPGSYALSDITGADDLKKIEALSGTSGFLKKTAANTWSLDTNSYVTTANGVTAVTFTTSGTNAGKIGITKNNSTTYTASVWASAALTGTPTAPTATAGTNSTQIATTAFVATAVSNAISGVTQIDYVVSWNGSSAPTVANIPNGVKVVYNGTTYTGTMATGTKGTIYLVYSSNGLVDSYDEYMYFTSGGTNFWERLGSFGETNLADYWLKNDLVAITATENTTLLNSYFPA